MPLPRKAGRVSGHIFDIAEEVESIIEGFDAEKDDDMESLMDWMEATDPPPSILRDVNAAAMAFIKWRQKKTYSGLRGILASEGLLPRRSKKAMDYPREGLKLSSDWRAESLLDEALLGLVEEIQQETEKEEGNPNIDWGSPSYKKYLEVEINKSVSNWLKEFFRDRESWEDEG